MKRWIYLGALVVAITAAATVAVQFLPSGLHGSTPVPAEGDGPRPIAVVKDDLTHQFGTMAQRTEGEKVWVVENGGQTDLKLRLGNASCVCTVANLPKGKDVTVKPGGQIKIPLTWKTKEREGEFHESAEILTNDLEHPILRFEVEGTIEPAIVTIPPDRAIDFLNVPQDKTETRSVALYSPDRPDTKVLSVTCPGSAMLTATTRPMTPEDCKSVGAKAGHRIDVQLKPAKALGRFRQPMIVKIDHPLQPEIRLIVSGRILGPISAVPESIQWTGAPGRRGGPAPIALWVRGHNRTTFQFADLAENAEILKKLKVSIAPADEKAKATGEAVKARKYLMTVAIPIGTPSGTITGLLYLKTDHPEVEQIKIPVNVVVLGD